MRIFVAPEALAAAGGGELVVTGDEHHYLGRVRRARPGDAVEVVDGEGRRAAGVITRLGDAETVLALAAVEDVPPAPPWVRVLLPLIKGDRMDLALEKLVEVGADEVVVWPATRSVVRLEGARRETRLTQYRAAARAAARQCGRARVPLVRGATSLAAALRDLPAGGTRLVLEPGAAREPQAGTAGAHDVTLASGPEGGIAPEESAALAAAGFRPLGLGPRVLRAETAPVVAVALLRARTDT